MKLYLHILLICGATINFSMHILDIISENLGGLKLDIKLLIMLFILTVEKNKNNEFSSLRSLGDFINTMELDHKYTKEKIEMLGKVVPYLSENSIPLINKSILITEQFMKIKELVDSMKVNIDTIEKST